MISRTRFYIQPMSFFLFFEHSYLCTCTSFLPLWPISCNNIHTFESWSSEASSPSNSAVPLPSAPALLIVIRCHGAVLHPRLEPAPAAWPGDPPSCPPRRIGSVVPLARHPSASCGSQHLPPLDGPLCSISFTSSVLDFPPRLCLGGSTALTVDRMGDTTLELTAAPRGEDGLVNPRGARRTGCCRFRWPSTRPAT